VCGKPHNAKHNNTSTVGKLQEQGENFGKFLKAFYAKNLGILN